MQTREVVIELLSQLGSSREAREYLRKFSSKNLSQFAVIKVGGEIIQNDLSHLASSIGFLHHVGLMPIILHGAGVQLNEALQKAGVVSPKVDGLRVTTPEIMAIARPVIYRENHRIVDALENLGIRVRSFQHGVFECDYEDKQSLGLVGRVTKVNLEGVRSAVQAGALPIVSCMGESPGGQVMNINADVAARQLVLAIQPYKIIFLSPTGGLLNRDGRIMSAINLETDFDRLMKADWVHSGMRLKLQQIYEMLCELPASCSVSITSAENLTRELFTYRGAGTLIRRGEGFVAENQWDQTTKSELKQLLEQCFERSLCESYFDDIDLLSIIRANSWRAAAVIVRGKNDVTYMDKFAVTPPAQGEGLGSALWQQIRAQFKQLYWRSRLNNPVNSWYMRQADFCVRRGDWRVFGYGFDGVHHIEPLIQHAASRKEYWVGVEGNGVEIVT